jgi:hypothetical protein
VVDEHAETSSRAWSKAPCSGREVVHPVDRFDDDTLDPQVVTPDLLDEFGVVQALDPDS